MNQFFHLEIRNTTRKIDYFMVKYYDNNGQLHSVNLLIPVVYKYIPHIALIQPTNGVKKLYP